MFKFFTFFCFVLQVFSQTCPFQNYDDALINDINPIQETKITFGNLDNVDSIGFGFWSQCIPLWTIKQYENIGDPYDTLLGEQGQLMFILQSDQQVNQILYYVVFDANQPSVTHQIMFNDGQMVQNTFPPLDYEGIWIFTFFTYQPLIQQFIVEMTGQNSQAIVFAIPDGDYKLFIGGRGQITINQQPLNLNFYRGRLSKIIKEQYIYDQSHFDNMVIVCAIPSKVVGQQSINLVESQIVSHSYKDYKYIQGTR